MRGLTEKLSSHCCGIWLPRTHEESRFAKRVIVFKMRHDMNSVHSRKLKRESLFHFNSELHKTKIHGDKAQPRVARLDFRTHSAHVRRQPLALLPAFAWDAWERTTLRALWIYATLDNGGRFATASAKSKARSRRRNLPQRHAALSVFA